MLNKFLELPVGSSILSTFISGEGCAYSSLSSCSVKYFFFAYLISNNWFEWTQLQKPRKKEKGRNGIAQGHLSFTAGVYYIDS